MATRKIGICYVPVLLSFNYEADAEEDAQILMKELLLELFAEWEGTEMEYGSMIAAFGSLDWLRGSYLDQVQEVAIDSTESGGEEQAEDS